MTWKDRLKKFLDSSSVPESGDTIEPAAGS